MMIYLSGKEKPASAVTRLCKDCRWAELEESESGMVWRCTHQRSKFVPPPDYVTGKPVKPRQLRCFEARLFGYTCGPQGRLLEAQVMAHSTQVDLQEQVARIHRLIAETTKYAAEQRQLGPKQGTAIAICGGLSSSRW